jgi:hypothetical protein
MIRQRSSQKAVGVRLARAVDNYLRKKQRRKGDLSRLISEAVQAVDLSAVPLTLFHGKREKVTATVTQVVMATQTRDEIEKCAAIRKCSMNGLLNSALTAGLLKARSPAAGRRPRRNDPVEWSGLSPQARKEFFEDMLALNGREPGPDLKSKDGSFYGFEPKRRGTVEVSANGRQYLVGCVGGGALFRLREPGRAAS